MKSKILFVASMSFLFLLPQTASAYIDPNTGGFFFQNVLPFIYLTIILSPIIFVVVRTIRRASSSTYVSPKGVGGWLRLIVLLLLYLAPISFVAGGIIVWHNAISFAKENGNGIIVSSVIYTITVIYLLFKGIQAGISLRDFKPRAVQTVKVWLMLVLSWKIIFMVSSAYLFYNNVPSIRDTTINNFARSLIFFIIWYSYFSLSNRVKATYPDWAEK